MSSSDPFGPICELSTSNAQRKRQPPPRPPPPKSSQQSSAIKNISIFGRRKSQKPPTTAIVRPLPPSLNVPTGTLIDLNTPSFFNETKKVDLTRSSPSSLSSQVESGFEDDFGSLLSSGTTSPWNDAYSETSDWASPSSVSSPDIKESFAAVPVRNDFKQPPAKPRAPPAPKSSSARSYCNPTIICVQPSSKPKPTRPPPPKVSLSPDGSPPMPSIPPPPPPADILDVMYGDPQVPPRPPQGSISEEAEESYCVAEYDYETNHPDDLTLKVGDVIHRFEQINGEWMKGELRGRSGMFPTSYVHIKAPSSMEGAGKPMKVICTFPFTAETWDDLSLKEGDIIKVTKRINENWLYGTCEGRKGQFPTNFVHDITELEDIK